MGQSLIPQSKYPSAASSKKAGYTKGKQDQYLPDETMNGMAAAGGWLIMDVAFII
jgi:hypothetical protein